MWEDVMEKLRFPRAHGLESEDARPRREVGRLPCRLSVRLPENGAVGSRCAGGQTARGSPAHRPSSRWEQPDPQWMPAEADGAGVSSRDS